MSPTVRILIICVAALSGYAVPAAAQIPSPAGVFYACVRVDRDHDEGRLMRLVASAEPCKRGETRIQWNVVGPQGPQGPAGPAGPQGVVGPQGLPGKDGARGAQGPVGATGATGAQGPAGLVGATGATGAQGPAGLVGATGATGAQGPAGLVGPAGPQGPPGPSGTLTLFGTNTNQAAAGDGQMCTLGEVLLSAGVVANGTPANGQLLPITQNVALFALIGTIYGGNGTTTFALPDLRAAAPNGLTYSICDRGIFPSRR
jgi:Phage Tail Collar Domain/Collagen triple helix repeat (20 copies)